MNNAYRQFLRFGLVGVVNNLISLAIYYVVIFFNRELYLVGNALGFLISTLNAYFMNSRFVFKGESKEHRSFKNIGRTYITYTISLCLSTFILFVLVQKMQVSTKIAPICSLMITVPFNFMMNKFWIYKGRGTPT